MPSLSPQQAVALATEFFQAGRLAEAGDLCRKILAAEPRADAACHVLAEIACQLGRPEEAVGWMQRALGLCATHADYHLTLGNALSALDRLDEAADAYGRALQLRPDHALVHNNLGAVLKRRGRLDDAIRAFRQAVALDPTYAFAYTNLGTALGEQGSFEEAIAACRQAVALQPASAKIHFNLGHVLARRGQFPEAVTAFQQALRLQPDHAMAWSSLGRAVAELGRLEEAIAAYRRALEIQPDLGVALNNLGTTLKDQGRPDEGLPYLRQALRLDPDSAAIHGNLLATLHYASQTTLPDLLAAHLAYDERHAAPLRAAWRPHANSREPDRRLRLGFVSPHFASHPVGRFAVRLLENLDPREFEIVCYSDTLRTDAMTARLRAAAAVWQEVGKLTDEQLAARVREDQIDIFFDLAGHTTGHRLPVFARKPAPIQITWCDYVGTTGLAAMDYLLADPREVPPEADRYYREKVLRMPDDYICYDPPDDAPPVAPLPALRRGCVTFGSVNILAKTTPQIIAVWARILHRVPSARLLLKGRWLDDPGTAARFRASLAGHGIPADRLEFEGWSPAHEVLACYHRIDVGLDSFPYNGGLTTCEALWMGVPVVTCPGEIFASRHGLAHLTAVGLTETIAGNLDEYVERAVALASDLPHLAAMRAGLRAQMAASPLCDGPRFARHFTALLRDVWRQWCASS